MSDPFYSTSDSLVAPARQAFGITPNDSQDLTLFTKAIYVGTGGSITLRTVNSDADVVFNNVQSGSILDIRCRAIRTTGTSAAGIVGLA
jgi:hypothetical protein